MMVRFATPLAVVYVLLWASAYVPSKVAATTAPPLWFLVARFVVAGVVMGAIALGLRRVFPDRASAWLVYGTVGVLANAAYLGFTYSALGRGLAAGISAIVASTNPLILALVAPRLLKEPLTWLKVVGLALGFGGGLGVMLARTGTPTARPAEVGLAFLGVAANVASTILFKRVRGSTDLLVINTIQLVAAGLVLVPVAVLLEGTPAARLAPELLLAFAYLVGLLSVGASLLWFWLLSHGAASRVSAFYFLTPVFGLFFGAALLGEPLAPSDGIGLVAIGLGILLVQRG
jgi:drug/metabolite transporter (DMT)-like permease